MPKGESNNGNRNRAASHLPVLVDPRLVKALDHVLRQHILLATVAGGGSPHEPSKGPDEGLGQINYHVKGLRDDWDGMIGGRPHQPRPRAVADDYPANTHNP